MFTIGLLICTRGRSFTFAVATALSLALAACDGDLQRVEPSNGVESGMSSAEAGEDAASGGRALPAGWTDFAAVGWTSSVAMVSTVEVGDAVVLTVEGFSNAAANESYTRVETAEGTVGETAVLNEAVLEKVNGRWTRTSVAPTADVFSLTGAEALKGAKVRTARREPPAGLDVDKSLTVQVPAKFVSQSLASVDRSGGVAATGLTFGDTEWTRWWNEGKLVGQLIATEVSGVDVPPVIVERVDRFLAPRQPGSVLDLAERSGVDGLRAATNIALGHPGESDMEQVAYVRGDGRLHLISSALPLAAVVARPIGYVAVIAARTLIMAWPVIVVTVLAVVVGLAAYYAIRAARAAVDDAGSAAEEARKDLEERLRQGTDQRPRENGPPVPLPLPPTEGEEGQDALMVIREIDTTKGRPCNQYAATSPSQFRVDEDGLSTFEVLHTPGVKVCALPITLEGVNESAPFGTRTSVKGMPGCDATKTPPEEGHWSIMCKGDRKVVQPGLWSVYAKAAKELGGIFENPKYRGGS